MRPRDPRDLALLLVIGGLVVVGGAYAAATWSASEIDDDCWFDFQCRSYDGFDAPRCSSWGPTMRCTLSCYRGTAPACPEGMRCEPAEFTASEGGRTIMSVPIDACHR